MENAVIARVLGEIADLLELKGENVFKIRAYRNAADTVTAATERLADVPAAGLTTLPGIGKDLAARIRELVETGHCQYHEQLLVEFPATLLDLTRLQGLGPKTAAMLHRELGIASVEALEEAVRGGRLAGLKGIGAKKIEGWLRAIEEFRKFAGRHLLADVAQTADALVLWLREHSPRARIDPVGSLRRGVETCGDLDILVSGAEPGLMDHFVRYGLVERVLGQGDTKASVRILKGLQVDLRLVAPASHGAAMQYFTGSKAHNIALRDLAIQQGYRLNEYGLLRLSDETMVAGDTEEAIYEALGLAWIPPELREQRGEIEAARARTLPSLIESRHLRGELHAHTTATDGRDSIEDMALAARERGLAYLAITDHSQALAMANGLDERRALEHAARIRAANRRVRGITLLAGIECDIRPDGSLDLDAECLSQLDLVIASVHSALGQSEAETTARVLAALANPWVDVLGHPTGRLLLKREGVRLDVPRVVEAAREHGVALEINSLPDRLDLNDLHARYACDRGVALVISTDSHSTRGYEAARWGVTIARRAWLTPDHVLNTLPIDQLRPRLRRARARAH